MEAGVRYVLTHDRWFDLHRREDRTVLSLEQDYTNNKHSEDLAAGVLRAKLQNHKRGHSNGGWPPYGFDRILLDENGRPARRIRRGEKIAFKQKSWKVVFDPIPEDDPDPDRIREREVVRWLFEKYGNERWSLHGLAAELNARGIPGPGSSGRRRTLWQPQSVEGILTNAHYCGDYQYGKLLSGRFYRLRPDGEDYTRADPDASPQANPGAVTLIGVHAGLVDRELWERVQERLRGRRGTVVRRNGYVLTGLLHCGACGARMVGHTLRPKVNGKRYVYRRYECSGSARGGKAVCKGYAITEDVLLKALLQKLQAVYLDPRQLEELRVQLRAKVQAKAAADPERLATLRKQLEAAAADEVTCRRNLARAADDGLFSALSESLREIQAGKKRLEGEVASLERVAGLPADEMERKVDQAVERLYGLRTQLAGLAGPKLAEALRRLVVRVDLYFEAPAKPRGWFRFSKGVIKLRPLIEFNGSADSCFPGLNG
jgi:hypothetical protein